MLTSEIEMTPELRTLYAEVKVLSWKGVAGGKNPFQKLWFEKIDR